MKNSEWWTSEQAETSWGSDFTRPGFDRNDDELILWYGWLAKIV